MEFSGAGKHENGNFSVAENGELVGFLEEPIASLGVGYLSVGGVLYPLDLDLSPRHFLPISETPNSKLFSSPL